MIKKIERGIIHTPILIIAAVIGIGVLGVTAYSLEPWDYLGSPRKTVEELLERRCLWDWEIDYAQKLIDENSLDDLQDDLNVKKLEERCRVSAIFARLNPSQVIVDTSEDNSSKNCPHFGVGPRWVRVINNDPYIAEWVTCYDVYNIKSRELIQSNICESFVGNEDEFTEYYFNFNTPYGKLWEDDCRFKWGEWSEDEIPVGFEDQYDFSDYQTEEYEPPLEPLEAPEPELEPLTP